MTVYVAPPFGAYIRSWRLVPVLGSYTMLPRPGRLGQVLRTVRPVPGGWINAVGLRNSGVASVLPFRADRVYSLAAVREGDWERLLPWVVLDRDLSRTVELNLGCPNTVAVPLSSTTAQRFTSEPNLTVIAKLSPLAPDAEIYRLVEAGVRLFHLSNTLPSPRGGISGTQLRAINLPRVARVAMDVEVIAGGGVYAIEHAQAYLDAGAKHLSLGTVFFSPYRAARLLSALRRDSLL